MKRSQVFPSTYLGKDDVPQPTTATIQDVRMETIKGDGGTEEKAVLHFSGNNLKPMILNNTNWVTLEEAYGDESDSWRGKPVEIYLDPGVMYGGKRVGGGPAPRVVGSAQRQQPSCRRTDMGPGHHRVRQGRGE